MMDAPALYNLTPLARMALLGITLAIGPLAWVWLRHGHKQPAGRLHALTLLTLFLTFDLVLFGAFTRLTDSGLGCPDWPGCYGSASPLGAHNEIHSAQTALPTGPVTHGKAWVEMLHRYFATGVGVLITVLAIVSWVEHLRQRRSVGASWAEARRQVISPWWATATLVGVCLQGAFGALTVTMKLYPAIVTVHLLGGLGLLVLLAAQSQAYQRAPLAVSRGLYLGIIAVFGLSLMQIALGGWVSTNYAVLACSDFPRCQGSWWPVMDFDDGFTVLRELGAGRNGEMLPFAALTAIHFTHRLGALAVFTAIGLLAWRLVVGVDTHRRWALGLGAVAAWQFASGLSNVVLGWPLVAAMAHTAGAAALVVLLTVMLARAHQAQELRLARPAPDGAAAVSASSLR